jgi:hypothetical protein
VCYLYNRTPIGPGGRTLKEVYSSKVPYLGHLRAWGCLAYAHIPRERRQKLDNNTLQIVFIGYMSTTRQYKLYHPESQRIITVTAPRFVENQRLQWDWDTKDGDEEVPIDLTLPIKEPIESIP